MLSLLPIALVPLPILAAQASVSGPKGSASIRGTRSRWTDRDVRWAVGAPKSLGTSPNPIRFPARLNLPPTGRLVPWRAASTAKWTTYVRVLPLVGAPRRVSVAVRDLGSGLSIETMSLYRGDGDRRLLGTLSSTVTGVQGAKRLTWNAKTATIGIEYAGEPTLVVPAGELRRALGARR